MTIDDYTDLKHEMKVLVCAMQVQALGTKYIKYKKTCEISK